MHLQCAAAAAATLRGRDPGRGREHHPGALAKRPEERTQTMAELQEALKAAADGSRVGDLDARLRRSHDAAGQRGPPPLTPPGATAATTFTTGVGERVEGGPRRPAGAGAGWRRPWCWAAGPRARCVLRRLRPGTPPPAGAGRSGRVDAPPPAAGPAPSRRPRRHHRRAARDAAPAGDGRSGAGQPAASGPGDPGVRRQAAGPHAAAPAAPRRGPAAGRAPGEAGLRAGRAPAAARPQSQGERHLAPPAAGRSRGSRNHPPLPSRTSRRSCDQEVLVPMSMTHPALPHRLIAAFAVANAAVVDGLGGSRAGARPAATGARCRRARPTPPAATRTRWTST